LPRFRAEVTPWDQYWTLLEAAATGGTLPDVFWMHSNSSQRYMAAGMLMDLTDRLAASGVSLAENFPAGLVDLYSLNGRVYAIPKDIDTIGLWYNKTLFDEAGLAYPDETWTWDTLKDAARKLTDKEKGRYGMDFRPNDSQQGWENYIYENGGFVISADKKRSGFDDPATIAALEWVVSFAREGISPPVSVTAENGSDALLQSGIIAMCGFGSWMLSSFQANDYIRENCDVAVLPRSPGGVRVSMYNGLGWTAAANGRRPEEAWRLLEYLGREDTQRKLSAKGVAISAFNGAAAAFVTTFPEFNVQAYIDEIPQSLIWPYSKNSVVWRDMAFSALNDAWNGFRPVDETCREIAAKMNALLAAEK